MEAIKQKLQSDAGFRQSYGRTVTREIQGEQQLEAQLAKQVCLTYVCDPCYGFNWFNVRGTTS